MALINKPLINSLIDAVSEILTGYLLIQARNVTLLHSVQVGI
jgi:hypothetical protein